MSVVTHFSGILLLFHFNCIVIAIRVDLGGAITIQLRLSTLFVESKSVEQQSNRSRNIVVPTALQVSYFSLLVFVLCHQFPCIDQVRLCERLK